MNNVLSISPRKITKNGQIVLPKAVRDTLGVKNGDFVSFNIIDGLVTVTREPINEAVQSGRSLSTKELDEAFDEVEATIQKSVAISPETLTGGPTTATEVADDGLAPF
jgi:AbrB family looped-hinge helix DNA binding protein